MMSPGAVAFIADFLRKASPSDSSPLAQATSSAGDEWLSVGSTRRTGAIHPARVMLRAAGRQTLAMTAVQAGAAGDIMIRVVVALVVSPVLLVLVGMLVSAGRARRTVAAMPGAFRCKLRTHDDAAGVSRWPRRPSNGVWVHDSLILASGVLWAKVQPLAVHFAEGGVACATSGVGRGLGKRPLLLSLRLDDGRLADLAAPRNARGVVAGPYLVAQLHAEPSQPPDPATRDGRNAGPA
jgi:hypothetical protein